MSKTEHELNIKSTFDPKGVDEAGKSFNKLSKDQKKQLTDAVKQQKVGSKAETVTTKTDKKKLADEKKITDEKKKQTKEMREQARLVRVSNYEFRKNQRTTFSGGFGKALGRRNPDDPHRPTLRSRMGAAAGGAFRSGIGVAGGGLAALAMTPIAAIGSDYQAYNTYSRGLAQMSGLQQGARFGAGYTEAGLKDSSARMAELGYDPTETIQAHRQFARSVGGQDAGKYTEYGLAASRVTGQDTGEIAGMFSTMRQGAGSFGGGQIKDYQKILAAGVKAGVDASTLPEYLEGIKSQTDASSRAMGGRVSTLPYAQLLAMFQKSGQPGLQGARGAAVSSSLEGMVRNPGGGEEGMARMRGILGFGAGKSFYQVEAARERGFQGTSGVELARKIVNDTNASEGGSGEQSRLVMKAMSGDTIGVTQWEDIERALAAGDDSKVSSILADATATEIDVLKDSRSHLANMEDLLAASARAAGITVGNIGRGEQYAESIEQLQATMNKFFTDVAPTIADGLKLIAEGLPILTSGMTEMVAAITNPTGYFSLSDEQPMIDAADSETLDALAEARGVDIDGTNPSSSEQIQGILDHLQHAQAQLDEVYESPGAASLLTASGRAADDVQMDQQRAEAIARLTTALERSTSVMDQMFTQQQRAMDSARRGGEHEAFTGVVTSAMSALGGLAPPDVPSATGGAR